MTQRSKSNPGINLKSAVAIIEKASKAGKSWSREQFANYGAKAATSAKSGAFTRRVAALKEFGLIETRGDTITITDLGGQIVKPIDETERTAAIKRAFMTPALYVAVVNDLNEGSGTFAATDIAALLVGKHGITRDAMDRVTKNYIDSAIYASMIQQEADGHYMLTAKDVVTAHAGNEDVESDTQEIEQTAEIIQRDNSEERHAHEIQKEYFRPRGGLSRQIAGAGQNWFLELKLEVPTSRHKDLRPKVRQMLELADDIIERLEADMNT